MAGTYVSGSGLTTTNPDAQTFAYPHPTRSRSPRLAPDSRVTSSAATSMSAPARPRPSPPRAEHRSRPRTKVTGKLVSSDWVRLDDGRYITTALLATTPVVRAFNGRVPSGRLRAARLPTSAVGRRIVPRARCGHAVHPDGHGVREGLRLPHHRRRGLPLAVLAEALVRPVRRASRCLSGYVEPRHGAGRRHPKRCRIALHLRYSC